jgi:hypothetical protein
VAAQDLKAGDKVRQAGGGTGTVIALLTTQESQAMFNLDVAELDNYYVGEYGWLVHNANCPTRALIRQFEDAFGIDSVHGLRRHGAGTTLEQQLWRAKTGYTPDGIWLGATNSTRFFNNADLLDAYTTALNTRKGEPFIDVPFNRIIGEGYYEGGKIYGTTNTVRVIFNPDGGIVSGFPLLPKR